MKRIISAMAVVAVLAACDEPKLPPVGKLADAVVQPDSAASDAQLPPQPTFVEAGVPRAKAARSEFQTAKAINRIQSGENFVDVQFMPAVKVASQRAADEVELTKTAMTLPLKGNEALLQLKPGEVMLGNAMANNRRRGGKGDNVFGFMRKVVSVQQVGDSVVVQTAVPKLSEVFVGAVAMNTQLTETTDIDVAGIDLDQYFEDRTKQWATPLPLEQTQGGWEQKQGAWGIDAEWDLLSVKYGGEKTFKLKNSLTLDGVPFENDTEFYIKAKAGMAVGVGFGFDIDGFFQGINYARIYGYGRVGAEAGIKLQAASKPTKAEQLQAEIEGAMEKLKLNNPIKAMNTDTFKIGEYGPKKGPVITAGAVVIPTTYLVEFLVTCEAGASADMTVLADAGVSAEIKAGVEYTSKNGLQPILEKEFKKWAKFELSDGGATATVQCWIGPKFKWLIGGVAGPFIDARGGLRGTVGYKSECLDPKKLPQSGLPTSTVGLLIETGIKAAVGGGVDISDVWEIEFEFKLFEFWWDLWKKTWEIKPAPITCPSDCENGKKDNEESGVDCGWKCAKKCGGGSGCASNFDCGGGLFCTYGKCSTVNLDDPCNDGKLNPPDLGIGEIDVDCGGKCGKCKAGQKCNDNADCTSKLCNETSKTCSTWDCLNGVHDPGGETGIDCGGNCKAAPFFKQCSVMQGCAYDDDCKSGVCFYTGPMGEAATQAFCIPAECKSFQSPSQGGSETGKNCGGPCVSLVGAPKNLCYNNNCGTDIFKCPIGQGCQSHSDCVSGNCIASTGKCGGPICQDGAKDGDESDVDCGGSCKGKCKYKQACQSDADCDDGLQCSNWSKFDNAPGAASKCVTIDENGKLDPLVESDVDCGQGVQTKCTDGKKCADSKDCAANYECLKPAWGPSVCKLVGTCSDGEQGGVESDVDCGGNCPKKCTEGKKCWLGSDCDYGTCMNCDKNGACTDALPQFSVMGVCLGPCSNFKVDPGEGDVDCGAPLCKNKCWLGAHCQTHSQCQTGYCWMGSGNKNAWKCAEPSCTDNAWAPGEADVDCGGICAKKCKWTFSCFKDGDCESGLCKDKHCAPLPCENYLLDTGETDIDCGGTCTAKCAENQGCKVDGDCLLGQCMAGKCHFDPCQNGKKDAAEADTDCGDIKYQSPGWKCSKCADGKACKFGGECQSGLCSVAGKCTSDPCTDGLWSAGEGGVDCGGKCAAPCGKGSSCINNADCGTGFCTTVKKCGNGYCFGPAVCAEPNCDDLSKNGAETDVDCGGGCGGCATGKACGQNSDCQTGICGGGQCQPKLCENQKLDSGEVDVDCGGACQPCHDGKKCAKGADCENGQCLKSGVCGYDPCQDGKQNGSETGVDCGGSCPGDCPLGGGCKVAKDCISGFCDGQKCVATACEDQQLSVGEANIDCGAACPTKCATGQACKLPADCTSTFCNGSVCVATACEDGKLSAGETDVDCGGACGKKCALKAGCKTGADCQSNVCNGAVCVAGSCWDLQKTDNEGDVDCGGACAAKCSTGKACATGGDCTSGVCSVGGACVTSHCDDGKLSGDETDVDCGGSCKTQCLLAKKCAAATDCFSGACATKAKVCVSSACWDEAQDKGESDVDCGGPCKPCAVGQNCLVEGDCTSEACTGNPADGEKCDLCANTDTCSNGKCALVKVKCPDDGNACTVETCAAADGTCSAPAKNCDDGNVCSDDSCKPQTGCAHAANTAKCTDSNPCTINEICANQVCTAAPWNCDDGNVCTADSCDPAKGCANLTIAGKCDDSNVCTADTCNAATGCSNAAIAGKCDDGNVCTNDTCNPLSGCAHTYNTAPCPDSDPCTINESCNGAGSCTKQPQVCDDGVECTDNQCNSNQGCVYPTKSAGSACNGGTSVCKGTACCAAYGEKYFVYNGYNGGSDGSAQYYTVPACATWVRVKARGANGSGATSLWAPGGGRGHTVWGYMSGLENKTLIVKVGGAGGALGGSYAGAGAIPGYNGGGGDVAAGNGNWNNTGTTGGGGATTVQLAETTYYWDQVLIAGGGGGASRDGWAGGDGGNPQGMNGKGNGQTFGYGAQGISTPGWGGVNGVYGQKGNGDYFQGGKCMGWASLGGGGGGGGYMGGGGGTTSCTNNAPWGPCSGETAGGGGGGMSYYGTGMQKTGSALTDSNSGGQPHGEASIQWYAGPNVP